MFTCSSCKNTWTRKEGYKKHFNLEQITSGAGRSGKLIPNPCFKAKVRSLASSGSGKQLAITSLLGKRKLSDASEQITGDLFPAGEPDELPSTEHDHSFATTSHAHSPDSQERKIDLILQNTNDILKHLSGDTRQRNPSASSSTSEASTSISISEEDENSKLFSVIRTAKNMDQIMDSDLVNGIFEFKDESDSPETVKKLVCMACTLESGQAIGFKIENTSFQKLPGVNQPRWFINMKSSLIRHLREYRHTVRAIQHLQERRLKVSKVEVHNAMQHLLFFCLKSSLSFKQYPKLLATANRCKVQVGNINHSPWFIEKYCDMVGAELFDRTVDWLIQQKSVTITLDIGTCTGVTLLAVLFISDDMHEIRLANIVPVVSKKGTDLATTCYDVLQMDGKIENGKNILSKIVSGFTGDGAFIKENKDFKDKLKELLNNENLMFRWDPLHLFNRAHIYARGSVDHEVDEKDIDGDNPEERDPTVDDNVMFKLQTNDARLTAQTVKYIQVEYII